MLKCNRLKEFTVFYLYMAKSYKTFEPGELLNSALQKTLKKLEHSEKN